MKRLALTMTICLASLLLLSPEVRAAKKSPLDLVPARASATVIIRNVTEFMQKGDVLLGAVSGGTAGTFATIAIRFGEDNLGITGSYDPDEPVVVVWMNRSQVKLTAGDLKRPGRKPIAAGVTIADVDVLAERLKVDAADLRGGKIIRRPGNIGYDHRHYKLDGEHLWVSSHPEMFDLISKGERLSEALAKGRRKHLQQSDVLIAFSSEWDEFNPESAFNDAERWIKDHPDADEEEQRAVRELFDVFKAARHAVFGFHIEPDGLELDVDVHFDPAKQASIRKVVRRVSPKGDPATLAGLPANGESGELLAAHAARTSGQGTLPVLSIVLRDTFGGWDDWWTDVVGRGFLSRSQQFEMLGLFGEVWSQLDGYRIGLYRNGDETRLGLVSLVGLLDTDDPEDFIREMRELGGLVDGSRIDEAELAKDDSPSKRTIKKLVGQLSAPDYSTRQSATTKLLLIGGPALKFVEQAEKSNDAAVARRARNIAARIRQELKEKRDEALEASLLSRVDPKFVFYENAEQLDGRPVHIIEMRTKSTDLVQDNVGGLLGPDWMKVRLVPLDGQVAVLLGSNTKLLETTVKNTLRGRAGLAADPLNPVYSRPLHKKHAGELHLSVQRFLAMKDGKRPKPDERSEHELSALSVTLQPSYFNIEWRLPAKEIRDIINRIWF